MLVEPWFFDTIGVIYEKLAVQVLWQLLSFPGGREILLQLFLSQAKV